MSPDTDPEWLERPGHFDPEAPMPFVARSFAFLDMCAFTAWSERHGIEATTSQLRQFRLLVRAVASHRGVRVDKWLGDGAMLVGVDEAATIATAVEIVSRYRAAEVDLRGGVATGAALMIDGDDYVGRAVNLAARLCAAARPNTTLVVASENLTWPDWVTSTPVRARRVRGLGRVDGIVAADVTGDVDLGPGPG